MAYFTLVADAGYLVGEASLVTAVATKAEAYADNRINEWFEDWTRTTWTGASVPPQIAELAEIIGSAHYLNLGLFRSERFREATNTGSDELMARGVRMAEELRSRGRLWATSTPETDGYLYPNAASADDRAVEVYPS